MRRKLSVLTLMLPALLLAMPAQAQMGGFGRKGLGGGRPEAMQGKRNGEDAAAPSRDSSNGATMPSSQAAWKRPIPMATPASPSPAPSPPRPATTAAAGRMIATADCTAAST